MNYGFGTCLPVQYEQKESKSMEGGKKRITEKMLDLNNYQTKKW